LDLFRKQSLVAEPQQLQGQMEAIESVTTMEFVDVAIIIASALSFYFLTY